VAMLATSRTLTNTFGKSHGIRNYCLRSSAHRLPPVARLASSGCGRTARTVTPTSAGAFEPAGVPMPTPWFQSPCWAASRPAAVITAFETRHSYSRNHNRNHNLRSPSPPRAGRGTNGLRIPMLKYSWGFLSTARVKRPGGAVGPPGCRDRGTDTSPCEARTHRFRAVAEPAPVAVRGVGIQPSAATRCATAPSPGCAIGSAW
jgi:hypothetical protein